MGTDVPYYSYEDLVHHAEAFAQRYNPGETCPVPIEEIAEFQLGLDIVPTPNLQRAFDVVAFTTRDLKQIWVDEFVFENRLFRYRFSLAHEIGHIMLHPGVLQDASFETIAEWKNVVADSLDEEQYSFFEWHANAFAGLVLVPSGDLDREYMRTCEVLARYGLDPDSEACRARIASELTSFFEVSAAVIEKRLVKENWFSS